jgi:transcriptional regulator GlxA family with amidase domain
MQVGIMRNHGHFPAQKSAIDKANLAGHGLAQMPKSPRSSPNPVRVIDVLTYPAVQLLDVSGPVQVFASANDIVVDAGRSPPYLLKVVAQSGEGATASAGVTLAAGPLTKSGEALDTLLVAGGEGAEAAADNPVLVNWVRQRAARARRVASVCTGAFLLGAAGLLDGRRAATHWKYCAKLAQRFPAVDVEPDPIFVCDGPVWTSAGVTAGIDRQPPLCGGDGANAGSRH